MPAPVVFVVKLETEAIQINCFHGRNIGIDRVDGR
jgi:hypothetical protein